MGGLETEVAADTTTILLESANFEPAGIRRCGVALGLRTEASTRFEKSLDPAHTVLAIQRFVHLARNEFPELRLTSTLSDAYPKPAQPVTVEVDTGFVRRFLGHKVTDKEMTTILRRLEFEVEPSRGKLRIGVPSFRATKDISIEADIIEEIARSVGYDNFTPGLPDVAVRHFPPNTQHRVEKNTLRTLCLGCGYAEVHRYIWYDADWLRRIGFQPPAGIELRNPSATGQEMLRHTLLPGLLEAVECNRLQEDAFKLLEIGTVFPNSAASSEQRRMLGLVSVQRGKKSEDDLFASLKGEIETWALQALDRSVEYRRPAAGAMAMPWTHPQKAAEIVIEGRLVGVVSIVPLPLRKAMNEHLASWGIAWAELDLGPLMDLPQAEWKLRPIPEFPEVELDFSMLVPASVEYGSVNSALAAFAHPLLRRVQYVTAFEGGSVPAGKRSLTYRVRLSAADRTLSDDDLTAFRQAFHAFLTAHGYELR
jgi:phenylalanyl-tRNA synthetase beta chain